MKLRGIVLLAILMVAFAPGICLATEVADATMCLGIEDRQPVEPGDSFPSDVGKVWCWSKIKDGQGTTIKHIYHHAAIGEVIVELDIRSPLFRTYSSKRILPSWTGQWHVEIVAEDGNVLKSLYFTVGEEPEPETEEEAEEEQ